MRWTPGGQSPDIEDRRSQSGGGFGFTRPGSFRGFGGPILGGPGFGGRRMGLGTLLLVLLLSFLFRNGLFNSQSTAPPQTNPRYGTANPVGSANRDAREELASILSQARNCGLCARATGVTDAGS